MDRNKNMEKEETLEKAYSRRINREKLKEIKKGIHNYIIAGKRYRQTSYTAKKLAEDIGTNTRYLSAAIRQHYNCNFAELVNKLRIEEAKVMLADAECTLTIDDIAFSCGFGNRQTFYTSFDKYVGMFPKEYRKNSNVKANEEPFEIITFEQ